MHTFQKRGFDSAPPSSRPGEGPPEPKSMSVAEYVRALRARREIARRRAASGAVAEVEGGAARYRAYYERAPCAYFVTDARGVVLEANALATSLLQSDERSLRARTFLSFVRRADARLVRDALRNIGDGAAIEDLEVFLRPRGDEARLRVSLSLQATREPTGSTLEVQWMMRVVGTDDASALEQTNRALEETVERQAALIEALTRRASSNPPATWPDDFAPAFDLLDLADLTGLHVLVVGMSASTGEVLVGTLADCGAHVSRAVSPEEALELVARDLPDVVVSDLDEAPRVELARALRSLPPQHGGALPAIAVTDQAALAERFQPSRAGYQLHLAKPIDASRLTHAVADLAWGTRGDLPVDLV